MELVFAEHAQKELADLPPSTQALFLAHLEKIEERPQKKHMRHGIPCHVEKVTRQARIIYNTNGDRVIILHCFATHKEYEKWYNSYR
ncbi:MAG TPA: hypothetical protein HA272_10155 [Methanoregula sp.]|nr:hypothetical protein [Methanoregula sp.]